MCAVRGLRGGREAEVCSLTDYRLYWLDDYGKIASAEWVDAKSDDEAVVMVRARKLGYKCEIWDRQRQVADVPAFSE